MIEIESHDTLAEGINIMYWFIEPRDSFLNEAWGDWKNWNKNKIKGKINSQGYSYKKWKKTIIKRKCWCYPKQSGKKYVNRAFY